MSDNDNRQVRVGQLAERLARLAELKALVGVQHLHMDYGAIQDEFGDDIPAGIQQAIDEVKAELQMHAGASEQATDDDVRRSAHDLLARFAVHPTVKEALVVFIEEAQEVAEAAHALWNIDGDGDDERRHLGEEIVDVTVTLHNLMLAAGIDDDMLARERRRVIDKNDAKTWETHHINDDGKIARREETQE